MFHFFSPFSAARASVIVLIPHFVAPAISRSVAHKRQNDPHKAHPNGVDADGSE
jgi:hypothetical protein